MKGGLWTETCSQNRSQTRRGKSIIYVFITSLNLGCSSECCLVVATCCVVSAPNWRTIETSLSPDTNLFILISAAFHWQHQTAAILSVYSQFLPLTPVTEHRAGVMTSYLREDLNTTELVCSLSDVVTRVDCTLATLDSPHWTLSCCLLWWGLISHHAPQICT